MVSSLLLINKERLFSLSRQTPTLISHHWFGLRLGNRFSCSLRLGFGWSGKGIRTGPAATTLIVKAAATTTTITTTTITPATSGRLIFLLFDQSVELAVLQHLAEAANCETQHSHGRAEVEGLLQGPG